MKTFTPYDDLTGHFDVVAMLSLTESTDRQGFMKWQNEHIDRLWDPSRIQMNLSVIHPHGTALAKTFGLTKENEYSCAREHYTIVKRAYQQGARKILVMEDDICLCKDIDAWNAALNKMPEDWDILSFNGFSTDPMFKTTTAPLAQVKGSGNWWTRRNRSGLWNAAMYALSRRGMEFYMYSQEQHFSVADMPIYIAGYNEDVVDAYYTTCPMAIQEDKDILPSHIRNKDNDRIDYARQNAYESNVDKNNYFNFKDYASSK